MGLGVSAAPQPTRRAATGVTPHASLADIPGREPLLQQRPPAAAPVPSPHRLLRGVLQGPGQTPDSSSERGRGGRLTEPARSAPGACWTSGHRLGSPASLSLRGLGGGRKRHLPSMCVSGPEGSFAPETSASPGGDASSLTRASTEPGAVATLSDGYLPATPPRGTKRRMDGRAEGGPGIRAHER